MRDVQLFSAKKGLLGGFPQRLFPLSFAARCSWLAVFLFDILGCLGSFDK